MTLIIRCGPKSSEVRDGNSLRAQIGRGPRVLAATEADPERVDREATTHASTRHPAVEVARGEAPRTGHGTADRELKQEEKKYYSRVKNQTKQ